MLTDIQNIKDKYNVFIKDTPLTYSNLPSLISICGYLPNSDLKEIIMEIKKDENLIINKNFPISFDDLMNILNKCECFKDSKNLLKHLLYFTNKQVVIKKDAFERMINFESESNTLTRKELDLLYDMINAKDDMVNLEEFVACIVDE